MKILIDTQCWLWWFLSPERFNDEARDLIRSRKNEILFSAVSSWEIAIKVSIGKLRLPLPPQQYIPSRLAQQGMSSLPIQHSHTLRISELPHHHRDPFDRLLIAQAQIENLPILTADDHFSLYEVKIILAT